MSSTGEVPSQLVVADGKANKAKRLNGKADGRALRSALVFSSRDIEFFFAEDSGRLDEPPANAADARGIRVPAKTAPGRRGQVDRTKPAAGTAVLNLELGSDPG